jgi:hypothetical protein
MDLRVSAISLHPLRSVTTSGTQAAGLRPQRSPKDGQDPMRPVAKALGLSTSDVRAQLRTGKSLNDLADAAGLPRGDLIAAIRAGTAATGVTGASAAAGVSDATAVAERTAAAKGRPRPDGFGRSGEGAGSSSSGDGNRVIGDQGKLGALSRHFNVEDGSLNSAASAKELVDRLQQNGADLSQLKNVLKSGDLLNTTA